MDAADVDDDLDVVGVVAVVPVVVLLAGLVVAVAVDNVVAVVVFVPLPALAAIAVEADVFDASTTALFWVSFFFTLSERLRWMDDDVAEEVQAGQRRNDVKRHEVEYKRSGSVTESQRGPDENVSRRYLNIELSWYEYGQVIW